jgi:hypothetical protein
VDNQGWMASLKGTPDDLHEFHSWFSSGTVKVINDGGDYFLVGECFLGCTSPRKAIDIAESRLELMVGAFRLEAGVIDIAIREAVYVDDKGVKSFHVFAVGGVRVGAMARVLPVDSPTLPCLYVHAAGSDSHLDMALRLWSERSRTWPRLYRIFEEVCSSLCPKYTGKGPPHPSEVLTSLGAIDASKREGLCDVWRFMYSANDPSVSGRGARHASGKGRPPADLKNCSQKEMSHEEAVSFVKGVLVQALRLKINSIHP